MLELQTVRSDVVGCFGAPASLDNLAADCGTPIRVARNELLLVGACSRLSDLEAAMSTLDPSSLVLDLSSSFFICSLRGDARGEAFCRLSHLEVPEPLATLQGLVAHIPSKVVVLDDELLILVSSSFSHSLRERVLVACGDLHPIELDVRTMERATKQPTLA